MAAGRVMEVDDGRGAVAIGSPNIKRRVGRPARQVGGPHGGDQQGRNLQLGGRDDQGCVGE